MTTPEARPLDDGTGTRIITVEANAKTLEKMRKEGHTEEFTVYCDEAERIGGDNTAPSPMRYMALSVSF